MFRTPAVFRILTFFLALLVLTGSAMALTTAGESAVRITADTMEHDRKSGLVKANGNVKALWDGIVLTGDNAEYDPIRRKISATGNVVIVKDGDVAKGDGVTFDIDSGRGRMEKARIFIQQGSMSIYGDKIQRISENSYAIEKGTFTTCDSPDTAPWHFSTTSMEVTQEEYASGWNVVFYIKGVPAFYFPYLLFPVKKERQSGFLIPVFGTSSSRGYQLSLPYYWAISPSQEATITLDATEKRGVGTEVSYSYLRAVGSQGTAAGYLINDTRESRLRGELNQSHSEILSPSSYFSMTTRYISDRSFTGDFGNRWGGAERLTGNVSLNYIKTWDSYALTGSLRYAEDSYNPDPGRALQVLPEFGFAAVKKSLFNSGLHLDLDTFATAFHRDHGGDGQRLYLFPKISWTSDISGLMTATLYAGAHSRFYNTGGSNGGSAGQNGSYASTVPEAGMQLSGSFWKTFDTPMGSLKGFRHEIAPEVSYRYSPPVRQSQLPFYDYRDRVVSQNMTFYGLTNMISGKFSSEDGSFDYRPLGRLRILQGYSFSGTRRDLLAFSDSNREFTDIIMDMDVWPQKWLKMSLEARQDVYGRGLTSVAPALQFNDGAGSVVSASYRNSSNSVDYFEGSVSARPLRDWSVSYTDRYSFEKDDFLEERYAAEYRQQCWSVAFAYHTMPGKWAYTVNFNLGGLFNIGN